MGASSRRATIRVSTVKKRAGEEAQRLLRWLEDFVNVGDSPTDYEYFATTHASFCPTDIPWSPKAHKLFLAYRELLRRVWRRDEQALKNVEVAYLLGMQHHYDQSPLIPDSSAASISASIHQFIWAAWTELGAVRLADTWVAPVWTRGEFVFYPHNDFQQAVYLLFRDNWRARICEACSKCFLADKPAQRFCSSECFGEAKRKRDLAYWRSHGAERRKTRKKRNASRGRRRRAQRRMPILRKSRGFPTR